MKKIIPVFLALFTVAALSAVGQIKNITIDSAFARGYIEGPNEPCIAIDPNNPQMMVAGSNINNYYVSQDGGYSWFKGTMVSSMGVWGDPVIIPDAKSNFYFFHLAKNSQYGSMINGNTVSYVSIDKIICQRLTDVANPDWNDGGYAGLTDTPKVEDKPWGVVDMRTGVIYLTWTRFDNYGVSNTYDSSRIYFSKSTDEGFTWSQAIRLNDEAADCGDNGETVEGAVPCVGPNGEIFVAWAGNERIVFNRSLDGGNTWLSKNTKVADVPGGWDYNIPGLYRCNGMPFTACDVSGGPNNGTLYVSWSDQRNGVNNTDIWICQSTDNGDTWSTPLKVNDDTGQAHQFMSSMSVDQVTGYIYVLFYDRRNYTDSLSTDVYLAVSKDGAKSFQNFKISSSPFTPDRKIFFGDYTYVSAYNNVVRPIWCNLNARNGSGSQKIVTAIIDSSITGTADGFRKPTNANLQAYPNPYQYQTTFSFELENDDEVSLSIAAISGENVAVLFNHEPMRSGRHIVHFDSRQFNLVPGIYLLHFKTSNFQQVLKLVEVK